MADSDMDTMLNELARTLPVIPIFFHIPFSPGVTRVVDTNFSTDDKGSIFLLERLEILKSQEARFKLSDDPQIAELVIPYAQLTPFGGRSVSRVRGPFGWKRAQEDAPKKARLAAFRLNLLSVMGS